MSICGIIAEYNPFHNGHLHQITETRQRAYDTIVAVMSPNVVQRGEFAAFDKWVRTQAALQNGVDLIIELPSVYACAGAESFAYAGIFLLNALGCVDALSFGSEIGDIEALKQAAQIIEDPKLSPVLAQMLSHGMTFAKARKLSVEQLSSPQVAAILDKPNNTLGIEYLKWLDRLESHIVPLTIPRQGAGHHDIHTNKGFASASYIRSAADFQTMQEFVPPSAFALFSGAIEQSDAPSDMTKLETAILARLRTMSLEQISCLPDLSEGLENRIYKAARSACCMDELLSQIKSKRYTAARIRRIIFNAFLMIDKQLLNTPPPYLRVLGFNENGKALLRLASKRATLPIVTSLAQIKNLSATAQQFAQTEDMVTNLYALSLPQVRSCGTEYTTPCVMMS